MFDKGPREHTNDVESSPGNIYKSLEWLRELSKSKSSVQPVSREVLASFDWIWRWAADNRIKISDDVPKIYLTGYSDVSHSTSPNKLRQAVSTNVSSSIISQGLAKQRIPEIPSPPEIPYKPINESSSS